MESGAGIVVQGHRLELIGRFMAEAVLGENFPMAKYTIHETTRLAILSSKTDGDFAHLVNLL